MREKAFTLVELLIVLGVISVITMIAYPYYLHMMHKMESQRVQHYFVDMLRQARNEAKITARNVMICTLNESEACDRAANQKLTMFYDNNANNKKDPDDTIIYNQDWGLQYGELLLNVSLHRPYIKYKGVTARPFGHFGHLRYCSISPDMQLSFKVVLDMQGNTRIERGRYSGCF